MIRVLILAYDFPPYVSVAGLRPKSWYEDLHKHEVYPIVITRQWGDKHKGPLDYVEASPTDKVQVEESKVGTIIRTPYKPNLSNRLLLKYGASKYRFLRKSVTAFYEFFQFFLPIGAKSQLLRSAQKYMSENKVDIVVATGEPFVLFNYARKLSQKHNVPWVADYRDVWSGIFEKKDFSIIRKINEFHEKRIVPSAHLITTVSTLVKHKIELTTGHQNIKIVPNGFDSESMKKANQINQKKDVLRIGMAGSLLAWNPIEPFLKALNIFVKNYPEKQIEFHFIGLNIQEKFELLLSTKFPELVSMFTLYPKMKNQDLHVFASEFNALLLFNNFSFMGTKIYDYLGLKRQIIFCFSDDVEGNEIKKEHYPIFELALESDRLQQELVERTNSGVVVKNQKHLVEIFSELHDELEHEGSVKCSSKDVAEYSRTIQVKKFAEFLKEIGT